MSRETTGHRRRRPARNGTLLDELIQHRAGEAATGMLSADAMKVAEELAKEVLVDEQFRRAFTAMVRRHVQQMLERLPEPPAGPATRER